MTKLKGFCPSCGNPSTTIKLCGPCDEEWASAAQPVGPLNGCDWAFIFAAALCVVVGMLGLYFLPS